MLCATRCRTQCNALYGTSQYIAHTMCRSPKCRTKRLTFPPPFFFIMLQFQICECLSRWCRVCPPGTNPELLLKTGNKWHIRWPDHGKWNRLYHFQVASPRSRCWQTTTFNHGSTSNDVGLLDCYLSYGSLLVLLWPTGCTKV